jgi:MFS family permease
MADISQPEQTLLAPLRHPVFRAVWFASIASNFGGVIQSVGAAWMMVSIARSADMVALVQASVTLPIMMLSLFAGAVADSLDRRRIMIAAQSFMLLVSAALTVVAWLGLVTPELLLTFTFLIGCGMAFHSPAWQASVGDMVPRSDLAGAVSLNSLGFNMARSAGPAIGGAIVAAFGAASAFAFNAVSYIGLIAVLARWRPPVTENSLPRERIGVAIAAGVRYVSMSPVIRVVLVRGLVFGIGATGVPSLMPLIAHDVVAGGPLTYGLLLGAFGVGAVVGALSSAWLRQTISSEAIVSIASLTLALATLLAGISPYLALTMVVLFAGGGAWLLALSTFNVTVQLHAPRWVVARAMSLFQMFAFGGMAVGSWIWGHMAEGAGIAPALRAAAAVLIACAVMGLRLPLAPAAEIDLTPLRRWTAPETDVSVEARSGPVVITIEYRIAQENRAEFVAGMAERRRLRRRDGARHWSLLRDLADAEVWLERFELPTWLDYVRFNSRVTQEDAVTHDRVRALHMGPEPPKVRRMLERQTGSLPAGRAPGAREMASPVSDLSGST